MKFSDTMAIMAASTNSSNESDAWFKIEAGQSKNIRFLGEPEIYYCFWAEIEGKNRKIVIPREYEKTGACALGKLITVRPMFVSNIFNRSEGNTIQIFEKGPSIYKSLAAHMEALKTSGYDISEPSDPVKGMTYCLAASPAAKKQDTRYTLSAVMPNPLTPAEIELTKKVAKDGTGLYALKDFYETSEHLEMFKKVFQVNGIKWEEFLNAHSAALARWKAEAEAKNNILNY